MSLTFFISLSASTCHLVTLQTWNVHEPGELLIRSFISCSDCARLQSVSTVVFLLHHRWGKEHTPHRMLRRRSALRGKGTILDFHSFNITRNHPF